MADVFLAPWCDGGAPWRGPASDLGAPDDPLDAAPAGVRMLTAGGWALRPVRVRAAATWLAATPRRLSGALWIPA